MATLNGYPQRVECTELRWAKSAGADQWALFPEVDVRSGAFRQPLLLSELIPAARRHLFEDASGRITLAYELAETLTCAAADDFAGNMLTPYAHAVCYERDGVLPADGGGASDAATVVRDGKVRKQCRDVYGRAAEAVRASRTQRGWF